MADGTSRQLTYGPLQIPLSEASKIIALRVPQSYNTSIGTRLINVSGGNSDIVTTNSTADLYVGLRLSAPSIFPNGTTIDSIIDSTKFKTTDKSTVITSSSMVTPARNITINQKSKQVSTTTTTDLCVGMPLNNTTYYPNGAVIESINSATSFNASVVPTISATATFQGVLQTKVTGGSNIIVAASTSGISAGMPIVNSSFPQNTVVSNVIDQTSFTASNPAVIPDTIDSCFLIKKNATFTAGSSTVTIDNTAHIAVGMLVQSLNIAGCCTVSSITNSTTFVISSTATATKTDTAAFYIYESSSTNIGMNASSAGTKTINASLVVGHLIGSTQNIFPLGTIVASATAASNYSINQYSGGTITAYKLGKSINATINSNIVTVASTSDLCVGLYLRSAFFPKNTVITSITNSTTFVASNNAIGSGSDYAFKPRNTTISVSGGSNICNITSGNTSYMNVGDVLTTSTVSVSGMVLSTCFPEGTTITSIIDSSTFTVSNNAIGKNLAAALFSSPTRTITWSSGLAYTTTSTSDLYVGQAFTTNISGDINIITSIDSPTTFKIVSDMSVASIATTGLSVPTRTLSINGNVCTVSSTSDLCVGMYINSPQLATSSIITSIDSPTTFVSSAGITTISTATSTFYSDDYVMLFNGSSNLPYKVPDGKTLMTLSKPSVYGVNSTFSVLYGYSTEKVLPDAGGRLRSHIEPVGAVHYGNSKTDYCNYNYVPDIMQFPSGTYPFIKINSTSGTAIEPALNVICVEY